MYLGCIFGLSIKRNTMETIEIGLRINNNGNLCIVKSIDYGRSVIELFDTYTGASFYIALDGMGIIPNMT